MQEAQETITPQNGAGRGEKHSLTVGGIILVVLIAGIGALFIWQGRSCAPTGEERTVRGMVVEHTRLCQTGVVCSLKLKTASGDTVTVLYGHGREPCKAQGIAVARSAELEIVLEVRGRAVAPSVITVCASGGQVTLIPE